jgi:hypothetical protein
MKKLFPLIIGLSLLSKTAALGFALYCWDTNGTTPGAGGATPTGTWGVDAFWGKESFGGTVATEAWPAGNYAVFAAGDDATGAYTVYVSGIVDVGDIHVDLGQVTFDPAPVTGGSLKLGNLLSVGHKTDATVARYNVPITDAASVTRYKWGTLIFGATNTFPGTLTIEGGLVKCAVPYTLGATNFLVLANNDTTRDDFNPVWQYTGAVFETGGLPQQLGALKLAGTDTSVLRMLNLDNGSGLLSFTDSSAEDWGAFNLTVTNFALGSSKLRFGTSSSALTATQLGQIRFANFANLPGVIDSSGYVTPALPKITSITHSGSSVQITWTAVNGRYYYVWTKDTLTAPSWDGPAVVYATGDTASHTDSSPAATGRYYRVEVVP